MRKRLSKTLKHILCYAVIAAMVVSYMPLSASHSYAASFNKDNKVKELTVTEKGYNYVRLGWAQFNGAEGYQVYRATSKDGKYKLQGSTEKLTYKNKGTLNKKYYYKVRAYKASGDKKIYSKYSAIVAGKPALAKTTVSVKLNDESVSVNWTEVPAATGYQVVRATSKDGEYKSLKKTKKLSVLNTSVVKYKNYFYKVRPYRVIDEKTYYGPYSSAVQGRTNLREIKNQAVSVTSDGLKITWKDRPAADGYRIYRSDKADGTFSTLVTLGEKDSYTDKTVQKGKMYYYKVRGYMTMNGKNYFGMTTSPVSGGITDGAPLVTVTPTDYSVKLSWPAISNITGYEVYRATDPNGTWKKLGVNTKSPTWENDELTLDTLYYYKVRTYKKSGSSTTYGPYSQPVQGCTGVRPPTSVKGTAGSNGIQLSWTASKNALGYEITRATSASGTYKLVGTTTSASFLDNNGLSKGSSYYYKIRGYMKLNGETVYGSYSSTSASRDKVVSTALAWMGCKESDGSYKKIIDTYNSNLAPGCGKLSYKLAWCAAYVSAVGIKAKATDIIVRHSYCPTMVNTYKNKKQYTSNKSYSPSPGDIIFFDWNKNNVPDHVGMVVSCDGNTVKTIEGNKDDAVSERTLSKGWSLLLGYGLPPYTKTSGIKYTGSSTSEKEVSAQMLKAAGINPGDPDGYSDMGSDYDTAEKNLSVGCGEDATELEQMKVMIKEMQNTADTSDLVDCNESEYKAAFIYRLCQDADIDACIVTEDDEDGNSYSWVEVVLDEKLYKIDPNTEECKITEYTPEVTDCNVTE